MRNPVQGGRHTVSKYIARGSGSQRRVQSTYNKGPAVPGSGEGEGGRENS